MGAYSKLHDLTYSEIKRHFPHYTIRENIRPDWLISSKNTKLELDLYIEEIETAIEIQGVQHYEFTPIFHKSYEDFKEQQRRDREKRELCYGHGVRLVEIAMLLDLKIFVKDLLSNEKPDTMQEPDRMVSIQKKKKIKPKLSIMNFKRWKQWVRRKILLAKGLIPQPPRYRELPGSRNQRRKAKRVLQCSRVNNNTFVVWGGRESHTLRYYGQNDYSCDCEKHQSGVICSHIIKAMMMQGTFPSGIIE